MTTSFAAPLALTAAGSASTAIPLPVRTAPPGRPFRIAMVAACPMPARRGTPLRVERLAEALTDRGHHVELITYHVADGPQDLSVPVHRIFGRPLYWRMPAGPSARKLLLYDPALAAKVLGVLARGGFDVIHAHHLEGLLVSLPARLRYRTPVLYDAHTMLALELPSYVPAFARPAIGGCGAWLDGFLPRRADHIAAVTPDIRERLIARHDLPPERISVVMNGVETERFRVDDPPLADGVVRIIYTGTLAPYQDVGLLLEAFAIAFRQRPDLRLSLCASSSFEPWESRARSLRVRGAIDVLPDAFAELPRRLAAATIAVLPRTCCPGIPQKLLNYMAAGKAIVASAGSAKILEHGLTGLIVPNNNAPAFADALLRLAGNAALAASLGNRAREQVVERCSWDRAAEQLESIYGRLTPQHAH